MAADPLETVCVEGAGTAEAAVCLGQADGPGCISDAVIGTCDDRGAEVVFRPPAPKSSIRICVQHAVERGPGGTA